MEIIKKLNGEGRTIVIITHSPEVNAYAKRFVTIKDGIIIKLNHYDKRTYKLSN
jgi:putative ABC transport system ATP-binding protein